MFAQKRRDGHLYDDLTGKQNGDIEKWLFNNSVAIYDYEIVTNNFCLL